MRGTAGVDQPASRDVWTVPNLISAIRILTIPLVWWLIVRASTTTEGVVLFIAVVSTDWIDGLIARRTGRVSEVGKVLDPVADRLAIAAGLVALVIRGIFPVWAAGLVLARDMAVLLAGTVLLARWSIRLDVRVLGKVATFMVMGAIAAVAWGNLDLPLGAAILPAGWAVFAVGIVAYYVTAVLYVFDLREAIARS
jgi:cardiolipin synthase